MSQNAKASDARAIWKAIMRNHPFFRYGSDPFGWDFRTFRACYPDSNAPAILEAAIRTAKTEGRG